MKNKILLIGGLGHWSKKTYIPALKQMSIIDKTIICDLKENCDIPCYAYIRLNKNDIFSNVATIKEIIKKEDVSIVVISCPPLFHSFYTKELLNQNVDFICDKPLVAFEGQGYDINKARETLTEYEYIYDLKKSLINAKTGKEPQIYSPLRRHLQSYYQTIYDYIKQINKEFGQNVKRLYFYENDGVQRWQNEMDIDFAHGYGLGLGKLTHTGYHIIDVISCILKEGFTNITKIECEVFTKNVGDVQADKSNKILQQLLGVDVNETMSQLNEITMSAELDIQIKYKIYFKDDIPSIIILDLQHGGVSNRIEPQYSSENPGDQGRTDDSIFVIEQGPLMNIFGTVFALSTNQGSSGKSELKIRRHELVAKKTKTQSSEIIIIDNASEKSNISIVQEIISGIINNNIKKIYNEVEFNNQHLSMALYSMALQSKICNKKIIYRVKKNDNLH